MTPRDTLWAIDTVLASMPRSKEPVPVQAEAFDAEAAAAAAVCCLVGLAVEGRDLEYALLLNTPTLLQANHQEC